MNESKKAEPILDFSRLTVGNAIELAEVGVFLICNNGKVTALTTEVE